MCIAGAALAQEPAVRFERVSLGKESDTARVNSIIADSHGAVWIAEYGGLFKYDSSGVRAYRRSESDSTSLSNNRVFSLHEDRAGNLWVGTLTGAASCTSRRAPPRSNTSAQIVLIAPACQVIASAHSHSIMMATSGSELTTRAW